METGGAKGNDRNYAATLFSGRAPRLKSGTAASPKRFRRGMDKPVLERIGEKADRRTELAADRTVLATERTYAAWMRTGLAALASGVGARTLLSGVVEHWLVMGVGTILILFSGFCFGAAVWREVFAGPPHPKPDVRHIPRNVLYVVNGFLALVAFAALVGIWIGDTAADTSEHSSVSTLPPIRQDIRAAPRQPGRLRQPPPRRV